MASTLIDPPTPSTTRYPWAARGDVNAFFGLMLDNIGDMILMATLLVGVFGFPAEFVLTRMIPGTALGVMVGDLIYTFMALRLARRTGRSDVTAMPLGLDTPSTFGVVFLVLGPAFVAAGKAGLGPEAAARQAWFVGVSMIFASGLFKLACAPICGWIRRVVPRAGLLGSLVSIALVIISFLPLIEIAGQPVAGMAALGLILMTLTARWRLPKEVPGALGALLVGGLIYYVMHLLKLGPGLGVDGGRPASAFRAMLPVPTAEWWSWFQLHWRAALAYLPVTLPLALATVVGGIDCTESAAAAGDDYPTGAIVAAEGVATLVGGVFGGVIQSTPYIGHPAYKAMGARAAYTLATALFIGAAGVFGYFGWIFYLVPKAVVFPILVFVGLEITAQSFAATPRRHYPALVLACVPALAYLSYLIMNRLFNDAGRPFRFYSKETGVWLQTLTILANGFIVTSLLWGTALARLIDGRARDAAGTFLLAGLLALFGVIHSPLASGPILAPWDAVTMLKEQGRWEATMRMSPYHWAAAYAVVALLVVAVGRFGAPPTPEAVEEGKAI